MLGRSSLPAHMSKNNARVSLSGQSFLRDIYLIRDQGYPTCTATSTCAREYVIPPPTVDERKGRLILRDGTFTSSGKIVAGITSKTILHAINQPHRYLFLDGTCLKDVSVRKNLHSNFCLAFIPEDGVVPCWAELKPMLSLNSSLLPV